MNCIYEDEENEIKIYTARTKIGEIVDVYRKGRKIETFEYERLGTTNSFYCKWLGWQNFIFYCFRVEGTDYNKKDIQSILKLVVVFEEDEKNKIEVELETGNFGYIQQKKKTYKYLTKEGRLNEYIHPHDVRWNLRYYGVELTEREYNELVEYSCCYLKDLVEQAYFNLSKKKNKVNLIVFELLNGIPIEIIASNVVRSFGRGDGVDKALEIDCTEWSGWKVLIKPSLKVYVDYETERITSPNECDFIRLDTFNPRFGDLEFMGFQKNNNKIFELGIPGTSIWMLSVSVFSNGSFDLYSRVPVQVYCDKKEKVVQISLTTKVLYDRELEKIEVYSSVYENKIFEIEKGWIASIVN